MNNKIKKLNEMKKIVEGLHRIKKKIVFTNGCFDLIHFGHVYSLTQAKKMGDFLIVAVNSDRSVYNLKGEGRPIMKEADRVEMLAALEMVDYVITFDDDTCSSLLRELKPDFYVKGGDYDLETLPEWPIVRDYGGKLKLVPRIKGLSTSGLISKIKGL